MHDKIIEFICCPYCANDLVVEADKRDERGNVQEGTLSCIGCSALFPVTGGIPRMAPAVEKDKQKTADAFGYEWLKFNKLHDTYREQFLDWIKPLNEESFGGKVVLDAGCGTGRHSYLSSSFGARDVVAVDLSDAVEVAYSNTYELDNVHVIQADILKLPLKAVFDLSYSIGVLHHMPEPRMGFKSVLNKTKNGGTIAIWVYGYENNGWIIRFVNPLRDRITTRLPHKVVDGLSLVLAGLMHLTVKLVYRPINKMQALNWLVKFLPYNDYLYQVSGFPFNQNHSIVLDHIIAPTAYYLKKEEIRDWFDFKGAEMVNISWRNKNSWRASCRVGWPGQMRTHLHCSCDKIL